MDNIVFVATIAGLALGIGVILAVVLSKPKEEATTGVLYSYDDQNRLQGMFPASSSQNVSLTPIPRG